MKLTFNQWQENLAKQLHSNYIKLKMVRPNEKANLRAVPRKKSANI